MLMDPQFTSSTTPLFSMSWTPNTEGQYAGTCIFLIIFAAIFRGLLAIRFRFHEIQARVRYRHNSALRYTPPLAEMKPIVRPWKAREAVLIASIDVILAGASYLLSVSFRGSRDRQVR